jgi:hypothetical protein
MLIRGELFIWLRTDIQKGAASLIQLRACLLHRLLRILYLRAVHWLLSLAVCQDCFDGLKSSKHCQNEFVDLRGNPNLS